MIKEIGHRKVVIQQDSTTKYKVDVNKIRFAFIALTHVDYGRYKDVAENNVEEINLEMQPEIWGKEFKFKKFVYGAEPDDEGHPDQHSIFDVIEQLDISDKTSIVVHRIAISFGSSTPSKINVGFIFEDNNPKYILPSSKSFTVSSGGCYIATMAYGDYDHPQVLVLRDFRDNSLSHSKYGLWFIDKYYQFSPKIVTILKNKPIINRLIRLILNTFIRLLN